MGPTSIILGYGAYNGVVAVIANIVVATVLSFVFRTKVEGSISNADFQDARSAA